MDSKRCVAVVLTTLAFCTLPISTFSASPEDEAGVKLALQTYVDLDRKGDVDGLLACYAADAKIDSIVARGKVKKDAYAAAMKQAQAQGQLSRNHEAKIRSVTFPKPNLAVLKFDYDMDSSRGGRRSTTLRWTLANREGRWLITETDYLKKATATTITPAFPWLAFSSFREIRYRSAPRWARGLGQHDKSRSQLTEGSDAFDGARVTISAMLGCQSVLTSLDPFYSSVYAFVRIRGTTCLCLVAKPVQCT